jgi:SAM-dependent methyltransferase
VSDDNRALWETHAAWWQEQFTQGADPEYEDQILPLVAAQLAGARRVLDVGCGEGQVARHLVGAGAHADGGAARRVVGVDPVRNQIIEAQRRGCGPTYAQAEAAALPFGDGAFDAAVACLVFEHIESYEQAIGEVARVLAPGGVFLFLLNHPLLQAPDAGWVIDHLVDPPEEYWRVGAYLRETHLVEEVEKGVHIPFVHRPLSAYVNALAAAGLLVEHMAEPPPPAAFLERAPGYAAASAIPRLLVLRCRKR